MTAINTVMYYTGTILKMAGITSDTQAMWLSAAITGVFSIFTIIGLVLVEKAGRRPLLLISLAGVFVSLLVLAQAFYIAESHSPAVNATLSDPSCLHASCHTCLLDHRCGFCSFAGPDAGLIHNHAAVHGACLLNTNKSIVPPACQAQSSAPPALASAASASASASTGIGTRGQWATSAVAAMLWSLAPTEAIAEGDVADHSRKWYAVHSDVALSSECPSKYSWLTIVAMCLFLCCFGIGVAGLPWTINAEIFPTHVRSAGTGYATAVNWVCNLAVSLSFLSLTNAITRAGTFWLYAGVALLSITYVYVALPETRGKTLEEIEDLFKRDTDDPVAAAGGGGGGGGGVADGVVGDVSTPLLRGGYDGAHRRGYGVVSADSQVN